MTEERLCSEHLDWISQLQEEYYPEPFRTDPEKLARKLAMLEKVRPFLSWVLSESGRPTAYIIALYSTSCFQSDPPERVVSIDDLIIEPGRPHDLFRLLKLLQESTVEAELDHLAVETTCRRGAYEIITSHPRIVERLGYELVAEDVFWAPAFGEELTWLRYHPIRAAEFQTHDSTMWSSELLDEARLRHRYA